MSAPLREIHLVVPGPLEQRTGGYLYDAGIARGLVGRGWTVTAHALEGSFPTGDERARASLAATLAGLPDGAIAILDGLAIGALPEPLEEARHRIRPIALVHHPLADESGLARSEALRLDRLERRALAACCGVIVTSPFTEARLVEWRIPPPPVRVVRPGTDAAPAAVGPGDGEPPLLLSVGSVIPRKGHDVLVEALARLTGLAWTCVVAGSLERAPAFAERVLDLARGAGLEGRVRFVGERSGEELDELYRGASLFVLPSRYEGYGMALAEALARGLPVVATTGGAIPGTVPADAGVLVAPDDPGQLAGALEPLLVEGEGTARRDGLSGAARRHGLALPTWEEAAALFEAAVEGLAGRG